LQDVKEGNVLNFDDARQKFFNKWAK
jgi:hypothetical protein